MSGLLDDGRSQDPRNELPTLCAIGIQVLEVLLIHTIVRIDNALI